MEKALLPLSIALPRLAYGPMSIVRVRIIRYKISQTVAYPWPISFEPFPHQI
jgi:hypothetical protein